jgi:hypothetical protein
MEHNEFLKQAIETIAQKARDEGQLIEIKLRYYIAVKTTTQEFHFQGDEAAELYNSCPSFVSPEDYILFLAQTWEKQL